MRRDQSSVVESQTVADNLRRRSKNFPVEVEYSVVGGYSGCNLDRSSVICERKVLFVHYTDEGCFAAGRWHDYTWSFNFGVQNHLDRALSLEIFVNAENRDNFKGDEFKVFERRPHEKNFEHASITGRTDGFRRYYFVVSLQPKETVYFANTIARNYDDFITNLEEKAARDGVVCRGIGRTVEHRSIRAFEFGDVDNRKPNLVFSSGFHPPECDTFATEAIFSHLINSDGKVRLRDFNVIVIPACNPDGFVHGFNGANANGINLYWNFEYDNSVRCPEASALWRYLRHLKPVLYVDFHAYVTQPTKRMGPYIKPVRLYAGSTVRAIVHEMDAFLVELAGGHCERGYFTYAPTTLAYLLTRYSNTITYTKFHFHLRDGVSKMQVLAVQVFDGLCDILQKHKVDSGSRVLTRPFGNIHRTAYEWIWLRSLVFKEVAKIPFRRFKEILK